MARTVFGGDYPHAVRLLIAARKSLGLTQAQLAARIGRRQGHISLIEKGQRRIDVIEFVRLSQALETPPENMMAELVRAMNASKEVNFGDK